jgi:hypothetical protein
MLSKQTWIVQWIDRSIEVHEEHAQEGGARTRARTLGGKVIKVYRRDVWVDKTPPPTD